MLKKSQFLPKISLRIVAILLTVGLLSVTDCVLGQSKSGVSEKNKISEKAKQSDLIQTSVYLSSEVYCSDKDMIVKSHLTIKNISKRTLIFCKSCLSIGGSYIARDEKLIKEEIFEYDILGFGWKTIEITLNSKPDQEPFIMLKTGETFTKELNAHLINFTEKDTILPSGDYVLTQIIRTGPFPTKEIESLQQKWKNEGLMWWIDDVITPPMKFTIENKPTFQLCQ